MDNNGIFMEKDGRILRILWRSVEICGVHMLRAAASDRKRCNRRLQDEPEPMPEAEPESAGFAEPDM